MIHSSFKSIPSFLPYFPSPLPRNTISRLIHSFIQSVFKWFIHPLNQFLPSFQRSLLPSLELRWRKRSSADQRESSFEGQSKSFKLLWKSDGLLSQRRSVLPSSKAYVPGPFLDASFFHLFFGITQGLPVCSMAHPSLLHGPPSCFWGPPTYLYVPL